MNATARKIGPAYIADAGPGSVIRFTDPRNGTSIVGMVATIESFDNGRGSSARAFTLHGVDHTFRVSCNFHVTIDAWS